MDRHVADLLFPSVTSEKVCWKRTLRWSVQKTIRETGGIIDEYHNLDDVRRWNRHPESYPKELRKKEVFLWKTFDDSPENFSIWALSWDKGTRTFLPYRFKLDSLRAAA